MLGSNREGVREKEREEESETPLDDFAQITNTEEQREEEGKKEGQALT